MIDMVLTHTKCLTLLPPSHLTPLLQVIRELSRNKWMNPTEAVDHGIVDRVTNSTVLICLPCCLPYCLSVPLLHT